MRCGQVFGMARLKRILSHRLCFEGPRAMFERYTEDSRRALFFARAKSAERGGDSIAADDLLGGIVWSSPHLVARVIPKLTDSLPSKETAEDLMRRLHNHKVSFGAISKEIPFSEEAKLILGRGAQEADLTCPAT